MVEDMDKNLGEVVSFFGLEVQAEMKEFVLTHTDSKCNAQNSYVITPLGNCNGLHIHQKFLK